MFRVSWPAAVVLLAAACGGASDGNRTTTAPPAAVARVVVSGPSSSMNVGQTLQLTANLYDASGNVLTGRTVTWSSTNQVVASVSDSGLVTGLTDGTSTISASSGGRVGFVGITVVPVGAATVTVTPATTSLVPGDSLQLSATVRDFNGNVLTDKAVTWTSSDTTRARVSAAGLVKTLGAVTTPHITSIAPAQITPGATVTISGTGFDSTASGVRVTLIGTPALVTAATPTQITVSVPAILPCTPTGPATVAVSNIFGSVTITASVDGKSGSASLALGSHPDSAQHQMQVATQRSLTVGQAVLVTDAAQVGCNELVGSAARYLVDVYNDLQSPNASVSFVVRGAGGVGAAAARATRAPAAPVRVAPPAPAPGVDVMAVRHLFDGHARRLAAASAAVRPIMAEMKAGVRPRASYSTVPGAAARAVIPQTVGATTTLKYGTGTGCQTYDTVTARVVYVGTHSVVLEDTAAPLAGQIDSVYVSLAQKFDTLMYPILTTYFGDPMAFDDSLSRVGKVAMLFSKRVNDESAGLLGFVTPCDMLPAAYNTQIPSSNNTELFYARVPTALTGTGIDDLPGWRRIMGATLIHETKHITAIAERFADPVGTSLEESWLEEGTAQVASELYARVMYHGNAAWKSDAQYGGTVYCDLRGSSTAGPCANAEFLMADQFAFLSGYLEQNERTSFLSPGSVDSDIYGSAWLFARWLLDQYSGSEGDLMKPLVGDATMSGVANITDKTGRSWDELDGYFTLMLAADDYPGFTFAAGARYEEPSWNLRSIYTGLNTDDPNDYPAWPLAARPFPFGSWTASIDALAGGSAALFDISGTQGAPQLIDVHAVDGTPPAPGTPLRMVILRIQ